MYKVKETEIIEVDTYLTSSIVRVAWSATIERKAGLSTGTMLQNTNSIILISTDLII